MDVGMTDNNYTIRDNADEYLSYFALREEPFAPTSDPAWFHAAPHHIACLKRLWRCIDRREGVAIALGDFGVGKSMLMRKIASDLCAAPDQYAVAVVGAPIGAWTSHELLEHIVRQFGLNPLDTSASGLCEAMNAHLLSNVERNCVLLIDDAHHLGRRSHLELLRILQTLETPRHKLLSILCFANTEWAQALQAVPGFTQHASDVVSIEPARLDAVEQLIPWRIHHAAIPGNARQTPRFSATALRAMHAYAAGNLRLVMNTCRNALFQAWRQQTRLIDHEIVLNTLESFLSMDDNSRARVATVLLDAARHSLEVKRPPEETPVSAPTVPPLETPAKQAPAYASERDKKAAELLLKNVPGHAP